MWWRAVRQIGRPTAQLYHLPWRWR